MVGLDAKLSGVYSVGEVDGVGGDYNESRGVTKFKGAINYFRQSF